jgi:teichoic acid transport system permease protein
VRDEEAGVAPSLAPHPEASSVTAVTYAPSGRSEKFFEYAARTWRYRHFILGYAWAELRERYLRHRLATMWLVLNPLLLAASYTFLVLVLRDREDPLGVLAFITSGLFFFMFFRDAIVKSANSLTRAASLLLSSDLPKATLPAAATVEALLALGIAMLTYVPLHLVAGQPLTARLLLLFPLLALATGFAFGVSMLLAFAAARFRDLLPLLPLGLRLLLYLSPVLYTAAEIRAAVPRAFTAALWLNPLVPFLEAWHAVLSGAEPTSDAWLLACGWTAAALALGIIVAHRGQHSIGARL